MKIALVMYNVLTTERMSLMLFSALAKQHFPHAVVDAFVYTDCNLSEELQRFKPDIVAYSAMTGEHGHYLRIAREVREVTKKMGKPAFQIMGGPHCTFSPDTLQGSALDAIGVGECDDAWVELLSALDAGQSIDDIKNIVTPNNFENVVKPGALKRDNYVKFQATNMRPRTCKDPTHKGCLDYLPFLDWDLFLRRTDFEKRNSLLKRTIMTRRGCPFTCTYCFDRVFNALYNNVTTVHNYSIDRIIAECKYVGERWPTEFWKIYDDIAFFSSKGKEGDRLREFAERWPREIGLPFFVLTRADLVARDPEILHLLKQAGCQSVTMSIENGNEYVRNTVLERTMTNEQIVEAHRLAWDLGIYTFSNVIFSIPVKQEAIVKHNLPQRAIERDIESLTLAMKSRVHFLECPMLFPYPGTKLGEYCYDNGFVVNSVNDLPQSYQTLSPFKVIPPSERQASQNLAFLAMWCVYLGSRKNYFVREMVAPFFFRLTTKRLIYLPWQWCTKMYFGMYVILQQWLCGAEIYRPKRRHPFTTFRKGFWRRLRYEFTKQFPKRPTPSTEPSPDPQTPTTPTSTTSSV